MPEEAADLFVSVDGAEPVAWIAFCADNAEGLDDADLGEIRADLDRCGAHHGGGGAAASFTIQRVNSAAADRAPDCATARAAEVAGRFSGLVMRGASMTVGEDNTLHPQFEVVIADLVDRVETVGDGVAFKRDIVEGIRIAQLMIEARARSSVRTPNRAALSAAEAALALAEDALDAAPAEGAELPDAHAVLASIRDALRAGLDPLHAAEGQAPYDAGPPRA